MCLDTIYSVLHRAGELARAAERIARYGVDIVDECETLSKDQCERIWAAWRLST